MRPAPAPALLLLAACAAPPPTAPPPQPTRLVSPPAAAAPAPAPVALPAPTPDAAPPARPRGEPVAAVRAAVRRGLVVPDPRDFVGAAYVVPYSPDAWYEVYAAAGDGEASFPDVTDIELEEGELLRRVLAPDDQAWEVSTSYWGPASRPTFVVHVKPRLPHLAGQLSIMTDRRKYTLRLRSFVRDKHVVVRFRHPPADPALPTLPVGGLPTLPVGGLPGGPEDATLVAPACRNAGYVLEGGTPAWRPVPTADGLPAVCDDGRRTRIHFPPELGAIEAPSLWRLKGEERHLVNYRVVNAEYVVDGLHDALVLAAGGEEVVVRRQPPP